MKECFNRSTYNTKPNKKKTFGRLSETEKENTPYKA